MTRLWQSFANGKLHAMNMTEFLSVTWASSEQLMILF